MLGFIAKSLTFTLALFVAGAACGGGAEKSITPAASDIDDIQDDDDEPPHECLTGSQDINEDGTCNPDCSETPCVHGSCSISTSTGLAICTCNAGFKGDACDALDAPSFEDVVFWVDASDQGTITTHAQMATIAAWSDKGPSTYIGTTEEIAKAPVLIADGLNGRSVVRFSNDQNFVTFLGFNGVTNKDYTIFIMFKGDDYAGVVYAGEGDNDYFEGGSSDTQFNHYHCADNDESYGGIKDDMYGERGWSVDEFHLLTVSLRDDDIRIWVDGNYMTAWATENAEKISETLTLTLGANIGGGNSFAGDLAEFIIVDEALEFAERRFFEDYLAAKWFGAAFERTPSSFGPTTVWLDASNLENVVTVNDDAVSDWHNHGIQGGFFNNGSFANARPQLVQNALGGLPVVRFDGADALVQNAVPMSAGGLAGEYTIIAVVVPPTSGESQLLFRADSEGDRVLDLQIDGDAKSLSYEHRWPAAGGDVDEVKLVSLDYSMPQLIKIKRSGTANYNMSANAAYTNVPADTSTNMSEGIQLDWGLGGELLNDPGDGFAGDIAEFIVLSTELGDADEAALLDMLRQKWGL